MPLPMDLVVIETPKRTLYSFLSFAWGMVADVDIESEKYRYLGETRFTMGTLSRIMNLRKYRGRFSFLPIDETWQPKVKRREHGCFRSNRTMSAVGVMGGGAPAGLYKRTLSMDENLHSLQSSEPGGSQQTLTHKMKKGISMYGISEHDGQLREENLQHINDSYHGGTGGSESEKDRSNLTSLLPPFDRSVPNNWVTIEDEFITVLGAYQTHLSSDIFAAPDCKLQDGCIHVIFLRAGVSRRVVLQLFLDLQDGTHTDSHFIESVIVKAFRLEPLSPPGHVTIDGEEIEYGPVQGQVWPSAATIMAIEQ